jgi:hypothetical protein
MHGLDADLGGITSARRYCFATSVPMLLREDFETIFNMYIHNVIHPTHKYLDEIMNTVAQLECTCKVQKFKCDAHIQCVVV